jgi:acetyl esterase/lipase
VGWTLILAALLVAALAAIWLWATNNDAVALLDRIDRAFTAGDAELAIGPVAYGEHPQQRLLAYRPAGSDASGSLPVLVFFHGGGWHSGRPEDYAFVARNFAPEGFVVVTAGYRLNEAGRYPAMLEDGAAAVRWVRDNAPDLGGDASRIYLMGHSAGAYNAIMLALDPQWLANEGLSPDAIEGAIGLAGPYDFYPFDKDSSRNAFGHVATPEITQPIAFARADAPALLLATGDEDTIVRPRNSFALARALTRAGRPSEPVVFEGMDHKEIVMALARPFDRDARVKRAVLDFLAAPETERAPVQPAAR